MTSRCARIPDVFPTLSVGDLILREVQTSDADAWFARNSDPRVIYPMMGEPMNLLSEAVAAIESVREGFRNKTLLRWAITASDGGPAIGSTGFNNFDENSGRAELGFGIDRDWWGRGIMTTATRACIDYAFAELGLNRIDATVLEDNEQSLRVLQKLGFQREGLRRDYQLVSGELRNVWMLGLLDTGVPASPANQNGPESHNGGERSLPG